MTIFDPMLRVILDEVPGARGAVFCDSLGEAVNSVGASGRESPRTLDDFDLRVAGAQLAVPVDQILRHATEDLGTLQELIVRGPRETLLVHYLKDGYFLVVCLAPGALPSQGMAALRRVAARVLVEI